MDTAAVGRVRGIQVLHPPLKLLLLHKGADSAELLKLLASNKNALSTARRLGFLKSIQQPRPQDRQPADIPAHADPEPTPAGGNSKQRRYTARKALQAERVAAAAAAAAKLLPILRLRKHMLIYLKRQRYQRTMDIWTHWQVANLPIRPALAPALDIKSPAWRPSSSAVEIIDPATVEAPGPPPATETFDSVDYSATCADRSPSTSSTPSAPAADGSRRLEGDASGESSVPVPPPEPEGGTSKRVTFLPKPGRQHQHQDRQGDAESWQARGRQDGAINNALGHVPHTTRGAGRRAAFFRHDFRSGASPQTEGPPHDYMQRG